MFPRTWSEELVSEWVQLKGYVVEAGVPILSTVAGGRAEADVLGFRGEDDTLEILHIEVGTLPGGQKEDLKMVSNKFSPERVEAIKDYAKSKFKVAEVKYRPMYIAVYVSVPSLLNLRNHGYNVKHFADVIKDDIIPDLKKWKEDAPARTKDVTPPDGLWLIKLLDYYLVWVIGNRGRRRSKKTANQVAE